MRIGIDIDDTITDTKTLQKIFWKEYIKNNPNPKYNEKLPENINEFGDLYINNFWDIYREKLAYEVKLKENVSEIIKKLRNDGYQICIVTLRQDNKYKNHRVTLLKWLKEHDIDIDELHTGVKEKGRYLKEHNIDLLIDDNYQYCREAIANGKDAIMFNDKENEIININNWKEIYKYIKAKY